MRYVANKLVHLVLILIGVSIVIFVLARVAQKDPVQTMLGFDATEEEKTRLRSGLGLDQPLPVQYLRWLGDVASGNMGKSLLYGQPISKELGKRIPVTFTLAVSGIFVTLIIGLPLGVITAVKRGTRLDRLILLFSLGGISMPIFLFAYLMLWVLAVKIPLFPTAGLRGPISIVLPALTVGLPSTAVIIRLTRTSVLEVLSQDYVRTARAKGLANHTVLVRHVLRNSLISVVVMVGLQFGHLLGGSVITEQIFALPGVGNYVVGAISAGDYPVVQGGCLWLTTIFVVVNLVADLLYGILDPRITVGKGGQ